MRTVATLGWPAEQGRTMTDKKNWGSTVLGWFVVQDENPQPVGDPAIDPLAADTTAALDATFAKDVPAAQGGQVDSTPCSTPRASTRKCAITARRPQIFSTRCPFRRTLRS